jgi:eukaryotic-like serine/threonine-protein kinase
MTLSPGTKLGPYEIVSTIGAGGMGEVYRAKDTRLERAVAIKILSRTYAKDSDRMRRFELEARTVAALDHPNILGIHDTGTHEGAPYLVSELLEGETLRGSLEAGPLGVRRATEYALGIARGLAAAHEKGIVHRDLKPENVFIMRNGQVKVLDFGLAKLIRPDAGDATTLMTNGETQPGVVMGTVGYMSPEQVRGETCDARSDIFSFGAVLYEMLTGKRAFKKETAAETMTAILREEPPGLSETGWQGPLGMLRIVGRCLEKNVERRFQSASDLGFAIESLSGTGATQSLPPVKEKRAWWPRAAAAVGVLALAGLAAVVGARWPRAQAVPKFTRLTYHQGYPTNARLAKDGHTVVYSAQWNNDPPQVFSVRVEYPQSSKVDLPSAALLALSPDGDLALAMDLTHHANFLSGTLAQAQMAGGSPRQLEKGVIAADFAPDGNTLAFAQQANGKVRLEYPPGKMIYETNGYLDYVRVAPSGQLVAFVDHPVYDDDRGWVSVVDSEGKLRRLTSEFSTIQGLAWARGGHEIWFSGENTQTDSQGYAVDLEGKMRKLLAGPGRMRVLDVAADGRVLLTSEKVRMEITGIDPATGKERHGLEWFNGSGLSDVSPDGKAILFDEWGGSTGPLYEVVYRKLDGSAPIALGPGAMPVFSPDGTLAAAVVLTIPPQIVLLPIGAGESRRLSLGDLAVARRVNWFPNGRHLLIVGATAGQPLRTYEMDVDGGKPQAIGPADWRGKAVANDGKRIAGYRSSGEPAVFHLETKSLATVPGVNPGDEVQRWTEEGEGLLLASTAPGEARVYRVAVSDGKRTLLREVELGEKAGSAAPVTLLYAEKSKTYVYCVRRILGSLYVVEGVR